MKESVGYLLKRTREVREIELEEVSKKTKISVRFLQAIEEGRWNILPGDVFIKGFIRAYAQYLGLNPEEVVEKYVQERMPKERVPESEIKEKKEKKNIIWVPLIFLFLLALVFIYFSLPKKSKKPEKENPPAISEELIQEKPAEKVPASKEEKPRIELLFTRHCWLKVEVDGKNVFEGFKEASDKLEYNFKESFVLKVGDAGALQIIKEGIPQPRLGEDGQPVLYKLP